MILPELQEEERPVKFLAVKMGPTLRRALENAARREGVSLSEIARRALREYLSRVAWEAFTLAQDAAPATPREEA